MRFENNDRCKKCAEYKRCHHPDIMKRKKPCFPTDEPNPVRMPGRNATDIGAMSDLSVNSTAYLKVFGGHSY